MSDYYVYLHSRLNTAAPFYIGKGRKGRCIAEDNRNRHWKHIVSKDGGFVVSFLARDVDSELATLCEIEAIDVYRRRGIRLVNMTAGGEGIPGLKHSEESRKKMSASHKGVKLSESHRINNAAARIGRPVSQETREKLSLANKGQRPSALSISRSIETKLGTRHSEETKAKISAAQKGKPAPNRSKPSVMKGKTFSDEARKHMAESRLAWYRARRDKEGVA